MGMNFGKICTINGNYVIMTYLGMDIEKEVVREFIKFLREKNIYKEYRRYTCMADESMFRTNKPYSFFYLPLSSKPIKKWTLSRYIERMELLVACMRPWEQTPQGMTFWSSISKKWVNRLKTKFNVNMYG